MTEEEKPYLVPNLPRNLQTLPEDAQIKIHKLRYKDAQDPTWADGIGPQYEQHVRLESERKRLEATKHWTHTRRPDARAERKKKNIRPNGKRLQKRLGL